jgi:hypothetical protein
MSTVFGGETHYMVFPHGTTGLVRDDFTITVLKDNEVRQDVAVEVEESAEGVYVMSFVNDDTDKTTWTLIAYATAAPNTKYIESWQVRKKTIDQNVRQIRSRQDSDGGFFKSS